MSGSENMFNNVVITFAIEWCTTSTWHCPSMSVCLYIVFVPAAGRVYPGSWFRRVHVPLWD